jgi:hypothetical protein
MRRLWRWVLAGGYGLCIGGIGGVLLLNGVSKGLAGHWRYAAADIGVATFIVIIYRLFLRCLRPPAVIVVPVPVNAGLVTCVVEKCGEAWVLRECHTQNQIVLEEGDIVWLGRPPEMDDD